MQSTGMSESCPTLTVMLWRRKWLHKDNIEKFKNMITVTVLERQSKIQMIRKVSCQVWQTAILLVGESDPVLFSYQFLKIILLWILLNHNEPSWVVYLTDLMSELWRLVLQWCIHHKKLLHLLSYCNFNITFSLYLKQVWGNLCTSSRRILFHHRQHLH